MFRKNRELNTIKPSDVPQLNDYAISANPGSQISFSQRRYIIQQISQVSLSYIFDNNYKL